MITYHLCRPMHHQMMTIVLVVPATQSIGPIDQWITGNKGEFYWSIWLGRHKVTLWLHNLSSPQQDSQHADKGSWYQNLQTHRNKVLQALHIGWTDILQICSPASHAQSQTISLDLSNWISRCSPLCAFPVPTQHKTKKQNTDLARTNIIHQFKVSHSDGGDRQIGKWNFAVRWVSMLLQWNWSQDWQQHM